MSDDPLPLTAYIADKERLARIEEKLAESTSLTQLCSVLSDVYNTELADYENRNSIISNATFIRSIITYLKNYKGRLTSGTIRSGISRHVLGKYKKRERKSLLDNPLPFTAYITDKERLARIEEALAGVTGKKALCSVLSDVYETELSGYDNRNSIIRNTTFIRSIIPYLKNMGSEVNVGNIRSAVCQYILNLGGGMLDDSKPVTEYITDKERWKEIKKSCRKVTDTKTLCLEVIKDIYDNEMAKFDNRGSLVTSSVFVQSLIETILPLMKNYKGACSLTGIQAGIYKYVRNRHCENTPEKEIEKKSDKVSKDAPKKESPKVTTQLRDRHRKRIHKKRMPKKIYAPLIAYIKDDRRKEEIIKALAEAEHLDTICFDVINDIYENELATMEDRDAIIVSTPFVESILPMLKSYKYNRKVANIKSGIYLYLLSPKKK